MSFSARDKKILMVMAPLTLVLVYWFMLLAPQRQAAADAGKTLEAEQAQLAGAEAQASTVRAAKESFARDYAAVVALGKAIPTSVDMPSLLVQLEQAASGTGIDIEGITIGERAPATEAAVAAVGAPAAPDPAAPTAPSGQPPQSGAGQAVAGATEAANTASAPPAATGATGASGATGAAAPTAAGAAPVAGGTAPAAGALEAVTLEFNFTGSFFGLADFFHSLKRFVYVDGDKVRVRGRLLTIDAVTYTTEPETFPELTAEVQATVFLTPAAEGATAGATPTGPEAAAAPATAPAPTGTGTPPPTPTATATP
ncbi:MAG TPA: type II secretion system protein GspM [Thermoleophilaceae bacterium]|nr:type II secretion system protein GspM [Thermoleophilaceae bacterium]